MKECGKYWKKGKEKKIIMIKAEKFSLLYKEYKVCKKWIRMLFLVYFYALFLTNFVEHSKFKTKLNFYQKQYSS